MDEYDNRSVRAQPEQLKALMFEWFSNVLYATETLTGVQRIFLETYPEKYREAREELTNIIDVSTDTVPNSEMYAEICKMFVFDGIDYER